MKLIKYSRMIMKKMKRLQKMRVIQYITVPHQIIRIIGFQTLAIVLKSILKMEGQSMCG